MNDLRRVLIIGGGIGGATAAYALRRVGLDVHCIDVKTGTSTAGSGICLLHNALRALDEIGLAGACREEGYGFSVFREFDAAGVPTRTNPAPPGCGMRRPALARILETAAHESGAVMELGVAIERLDDRGREVVVTFSDGREAAYDLVVVADGVYSKARRQVFGTGHDARFAGQSAWRFNAPRPAEVDGFCLYRRAGPNRTVVGALPTSLSTCYFFFLENSAEPLRMPADQLHGLLRERLDGFTAPSVRDAIEQVHAPEQVLFRPFDITLVPAPWHRGRVVLLGDAAHAPTPQMTSGGGLAIEDAVVLARCLAASDSCAEGLEAYGARRFERVKTVYDASLQLCRYEQEASPDPQRSAALMIQTYQYLAQPF